jgi:hypothetical protein
MEQMEGFPVSNLSRTVSGIISRSLGYVLEVGGAFDKPEAGIGNNQPHASEVSPRPLRYLRKELQPALSCLTPSQMPRISRWPSVVTAIATNLSNTGD